MRLSVLNVLSKPCIRTLSFIKCATKSISKLWEVSLLLRKKARHELDDCLRKHPAILSEAGQYAIRCPATFLPSARRCADDTRLDPLNSMQMNELSLRGHAIAV